MMRCASPPLQPREFVTEADKDGLGSVLHSARAAFSGCRLHLLTYDAGSTARPDPAAAAAAAAAAGGGAAAAPAAHDGKERLWQLVAELAVWHRDVCIHNAQSLDHAAQFVHRVTRAVAEERFKQMVGGPSLNSASCLSGAWRPAAACSDERSC